MLATSLSGEEIVHEVLYVLSTELSVPGNKLVAVMRDHASVNNVAVYMIAIMYPFALNIVLIQSGMLEKSLKCEPWTNL